MIKFELTTGTGRDKEGKAVTDVSGRIDTIRAHFIVVFGGYSETTGTGGYCHKDGHHVTEPFVSWAIVADDARRADVRKWAGIIRDLFHQESVLLTETKLDAVEFL